jgi:hypothetical protein
MQIRPRSTERDARSRDGWKVVSVKGLARIGRDRRVRRIGWAAGSTRFGSVRTALTNTRQYICDICVSMGLEKSAQGGKKFSTLGALRRSHGALAAPYPRPYFTFQKHSNLFRIWRLARRHEPCIRNQTESRFVSKGINPLRLITFLAANLLIVKSL